MKTLLMTIWVAVAGATTKEAGAGGVIAILGMVVSLLGGWDQGLQILFTLMVIDYVTGVLGAIKTHTVNSDVMWWGGLRKITVLVVVGLATHVDIWLGLDTPIVRTASLYFYAGREGLSVVENFGILGVPLPPQLKTFLEQLQAKGGSNDASSKQQ